MSVIEYFRIKKTERIVEVKMLLRGWSFTDMMEELDFLAHGPLKRCVCTFGMGSGH